MAALPALVVPAPSRPPDQGMRAAGRHTSPPGDHVPGDRAHERGKDHSRVDDRRIDDARANRLGDVKSKKQECNEVEEGCPKYRRPGGQDTGGDNGGDRVGRIMQAVEKVENKGDDDKADEEA